MNAQTRNQLFPWSVMGGFIRFNPMTDPSFGRKGLYLSHNPVITTAEKLYRRGYSPLDAHKIAVSEFTRKKARSRQISAAYSLNLAASLRREGNLKSALINLHVARKNRIHDGEGYPTKGDPWHDEALALLDRIAEKVSK